MIESSWEKGVGQGLLEAAKSADQRSADLRADARGKEEEAASLRSEADRLSEVADDLRTAALAVREDAAIEEDSPH